MSNHKHLCQPSLQVDEAGKEELWKKVEEGLQNPLNAGPLLPPMFSDPQRQGYLLGDTHTTTSPRCAQHQAASPSVKFLAATKDIEAYEEISVEEVSASPSACLPV